MKRRSPVKYHTVNGFKQSLHAPAVKYLLNNFTLKYLLKKHQKLLDTRPRYCVQNQRHVVHYKTFVQVHKNFKHWVFKPTAWQHILPGKANNPFNNQEISRLAVNREKCSDAKAELIQNTKCYQSVLISRAGLWWLYEAFKLTLQMCLYNQVGLDLTFIGPCIANLFAEYNEQDTTFLNLFISVRWSTCFRRVFRPSSGAQNCTYSVRYLSDLYCYLLLAWPG